MNQVVFRRKLGRLLVYLFLAVTSCISVFPLLWAFVSSFNSTQQILSGRILPSRFLADNLNSLTNRADVLTAFKNSTVNTLLVLILSLTTCSAAGYGFEIYHDRAKDIVMRILMLAMMVPFVAILVPMFQMFSKMKLMNNALGFVLPNISTPFLIMLFRSNARAFPKEIIEASRIDGLSELGVFLRMFVPTMRPTYAAAASITFMNAWNAYLWPRVIMKTNESITMPILVSNLMGGYVVDYGMVMAGVTICTLPTVFIFFFLQKGFTEAIAGVVK